MRGGARNTTPRGNTATGRSPSSGNIGRSNAANSSTVDIVHRSSNGGSNAVNSHRGVRSEQGGAYGSTKRSSGPIDNHDSRPRGDSSKSSENSRFVTPVNGEDLADLADGDRIDALLEEKFKYSVEVSEGDEGLLLDDDEEVNDETFGLEKSEIDNNFDFTAGNSFFGRDTPSNRDARFPPADSSNRQDLNNRGGMKDIWNDTPEEKEIWGSYGVSPLSSRPNMLSVEEIEAQMKPRKMPTIEEIEAQMLAQQRRQVASRPSFELLPRQEQNRMVADTRVLSVTEIEAAMMRQNQLGQNAMSSMPMTRTPQEGLSEPYSAGGPLPPHMMGAQLLPTYHEMGGIPTGHIGRQGHPLPHGQVQLGIVSHGALHIGPGPIQQSAMHVQSQHGPLAQGPINQATTLPVQVQGGHFQPMGTIQHSSNAQQPSIHQMTPVVATQMQGRPQTLPSPVAVPFSHNSSPGQRASTPRPLFQGVSGTSPFPIPSQVRSQATSDRPPSRSGLSANGGQPSSSSSGLNASQTSVPPAQQITSAQSPSVDTSSKQRSGRLEYGQMRYGGDRAKAQQKVILDFTNFSSHRPKPSAYDGGWGGRSALLPRWERYADTMTQYEKEMIARIQFSQLVTDDPYRDDFYYQIYTTLRRPGGENKSVGTSITWQQAMISQSEKSGKSQQVSNQLQQQMQKLIEGKKQKAKGSALSLEGALGKISLTSVKNPRQVIQVTHSHKESHSVPQYSRLTSRKVMKSIEDCYGAVLILEQIKRAPQESDDDSGDVNEKIKESIDVIWKAMGLAEPIPLNALHPFAHFLSFGKGKKIFSRISHFLSSEQMFAVVSTIFARAESLDVCNMPAGTVNEDLDLFMAHVIPAVVAFMSEVSLQAVNACTRILLERHNMVWLAKSKAGLAFLTIMLSRAEILKNNVGNQTPSPEELGLWTDLYNFLFASLHTHFATIFPPTTADGSYIDDVYVWQFLSAMAVGATTVDHQRVLVSEVRLNVIETSRRASAQNDAASARALANVNLFLNALGLGIDASQLAAMG
ncbi:topoisomerase II-associated protein PAT1-domain-containing protein [Zopfochytrium polystomum]|nr:topoisomerase II-associated protein PAT1-domain-containing protein [Zopfochytrium polystomum]